MQDEIDLIDLGIKLAKFFKRIFWQLVIFAAIGGILGYGYYLLTPKQYESRLLVQSKTLTHSFAKSLIDDLGGLVRERNFDTLASKLKMTSAEVKQIVSIDLNNSMKRANQLNENETKYFEIRVRVYDISKLSSIQNGLENYLGKNPFVLQFETMKKEHYLSIITKLDEQIGKLKGQQQQFDAGKLYVGGKDVAYYFDPSVFNSRILDCELMKLNYQDSIKLAKNLKVINGFMPFQIPVFPQLKLFVLVGAGLGILAVLTFALLRRIQKLLSGVSPAS